MSFLDTAAEAINITDMVLAAQDSRPECRKAARARIVHAVAQVILTAPPSEAMILAAMEEISDALERGEIAGPGDVYNIMARARIAEIMGEGNG